MILDAISGRTRPRKLMHSRAHPSEPHAFGEIAARLVARLAEKAGSALH